jgi:hypothetical protein
MQSIFKRINHRAGAPLPLPAMGTAGSKPLPNRINIYFGQHAECAIGRVTFLVLYYGDLPLVPPAVEKSEGDWTKAGLFCGHPGRGPHGSLGDETSFYSGDGATRSGATSARLSASGPTACCDGLARQPWRLPGSIRGAARRASTGAISAEACELRLSSRRDGSVSDTGLNSLC